MPATPEELLVEAHRAWNNQTPCGGATHVIYVPPGRELDEVWAEICIAGRLNGEIAEGGEWHVVTCPGGEDCPCRGIDPAPTYRHFHNDIQVWPPLPAD
jgi:hypothetical protein